LTHSAFAGLHYEALGLQGLPVLAPEALEAGVSA
jgi:hypothetical protein